MIPSTIQAILHEAKTALEALYGDRLVRVVLYGSQARGDEHEESDVDLIVVLRGKVDVLAEIKRLVPLEVDLLDRHGKLVSIQPFTEERYLDTGHPLMMNVHAEGIEL